MQTLFPQLQPPAEPPPAESSHDGPFAAVALEQSVDRELDYAIPPRLVAHLRVGQRVRVPLGRKNKPVKGYVVSIRPTTTYPKIKRLTAIDDDRILVPPKLMALARWMSRYYCSPLGIVLDSIIPAAVKKKVGVGYSQMVRLAKPLDAAQAALEKTKAPKRRAVLARLLQLEPGTAIELNRLAGEAGSKPPTVRKLVALGLITITPEADLPPPPDDTMRAPAEPPHPMNEDQQRVFDRLQPRMLSGGFSVSLLHGVTGSGKTEVYLRAIKEVVDAGRRAIVLVPEIALTSQTVRRFTERFPRVAILHSGLTGTERHRYWQMIANGHANVVVGARSAIFAPLERLGVIVVDEEHEASYKQDQAPRYHGRDVAIKRAQLEGVPVLLGSATPSLEMYLRVTGGQWPVAGKAAVDPPPGPDTDSPSGHRPLTTGHGVVAGGQGPVAGRAAADPSPGPDTDSPSGHRPLTTGHYTLLTLPARVRGLSMPHVELVDMKVENRFRRGVHLIGTRLEHLLRTAVGAGRQAILLLNRRGYSNFVFCSSCQNPIGCRFCDTTMTYHRTAGAHVQSAKLEAGVHTGQLHCHYCLAVNALPTQCPTCGKKLTLFGLGTQRVEEELARKLPDLKFARVDSDSMRGSKDYEKLLGRFERNEVQVMLGTQMIAKGLDYPNVTLVGVISGDTALALPDFRAAERTFQLITQVAGRAGRGDNPGRVVLQTFLPDDPAIQAAIKQDFIGFARSELAHRREVGLPPYTRMVRVILRDQDQDKLHKRSEQLAALLADATAKEGDAIATKGPMPCAIARIAGYHRNQIVMTAATPAPLQRVLAEVREKGGLAKGDRVAVDVDPVSLL
jgi:primosomal protein N' (replication factor Y)